MTLHQLYPTAPPLLPRIALPRLASRLAADWWRLLHRHVAERHFLPRDGGPLSPLGHRSPVIERRDPTRLDSGVTP